MPAPRSASRPKPRADAADPAWSVPSLREPRYSQSLERGLAILTCFSAEKPSLGIADIADELGMSRSTTHRYVITLVALGYLEQEASRKYRLGLRVTDLGMAALGSTGLAEHAHPYLEELRARTSYTASLAVLDGAEIVYVDRVRSFRRGLRGSAPGLQPGSRLPAYCTALGKVLLAHLPDDAQRRALADTRLARRGPNTVTSKRALREQLADLRDAPLAIADRELDEEVCAIAAPVRDGGHEVVAAVSVAAHAGMISVEEMMDALGPHVIAAADRVSARLGYRREHERG
ncbi:MAG TPA: IclR family transcriptional regulator [Solirubrobacteraceae bacterium]|nr:IclR family transcriptional regulator [Solirubrobacteraceae bacterium]